MSPENRITLKFCEEKLKNANTKIEKVENNRSHGKTQKICLNSTIQQIRPKNTAETGFGPHHRGGLFGEGNAFRTVVPENRNKPRKASYRFGLHGCGRASKA